MTARQWVTLSTVLVGFGTVIAAAILLSVGDMESERQHRFLFAVAVGAGGLTLVERSLRRLFPPADDDPVEEDDELGTRGASLTYGLGVSGLLLIALAVWLAVVPPPVPPTPPTDGEFAERVVADVWDELRSAGVERPTLMQAMEATKFALEEGGIARRYPDVRAQVPDREWTLYELTAKTRLLEIVLDASKSED